MFFVLTLPLTLITIGEPKSIPPIPYISTEVSNKPKTVQDPAGQWEYLVISFGKTLFTNILETGVSGASKAPFYSPLGITPGSEAVETQTQMDTLGKFGWELVDIVGAIGGEQQMVFKRKYDPERSLREADQIARQAKALADARSKRAKQTATGSELQLPVNLDEKDADKREEEFTESTLTKLKTATEAVMKERTGELLVQADGTATITRTLFEESLSFGRIEFSVIVDATESLLNDSSYRGSQARDLANKLATSIGRKAFKDDFDVRYATVSITVTVVAQHQGKRFPLGSGSVLKLVRLP